MSARRKSPVGGTDLNDSTQAGALERRIELEEPAGYWEENVVAGRSAVRRRLFAWIGDPAGLAVLDAGCGYGTVACELAASGATVVACDHRPAPIAHARSRVEGDNPTFLEEDLLHALVRDEPFDVLLLLDVFEELGEEERDALLLALAACRVRRLFLSVRTGDAWSRLFAPFLPAGLDRTLDPISLLRALHLETPYRLVRQTALRRRNFAAQLIELSHSGWPDDTRRDGDTLRTPGDSA